MSQNLSKDYRIEIFESVSSTHDLALQRAQAGDPGNLWIKAQEQFAGRGRHGRSWISPPGNLYTTLLLIDPAPLLYLPQLSFVAGVALASALTQAIERITPSSQEKWNDFPIHASLGFKWPNDLLGRGAKLAGILVETTRLPGGRLACLIGWGVNCCSHPSTLSYAATNLHAMGWDLSAEEVFSLLVPSFAYWYQFWEQGYRFEAIRQVWMTRALGLQAKIKVLKGQEVLEGLFQGIDSSGRLLIRQEGHNLSLEAGEVFLSQEISLS